MTTIAEELKENPDLAEEILAMAGKMSLAFMAVKLREMDQKTKTILADNRELKRTVQQMSSEHSTMQRETTKLQIRLATAESRLDKASEKFKELQSKTTQEGETSE